MFEMRGGAGDVLAYARDAALRDGAASIDPGRSVDDAARCADALVSSIAEERQAVARRFARVAEWADLHSPQPPPLDEEGRPLRRVPAQSPRASVLGGAEGTPEVTRAGLVELGVLLGTSTGSAMALLRDVLELRHRLPVHWEAVQSLRIDGWKARRVARATHQLSADEAAIVDTEVIGAVTNLPWGRAQDVIDARVIAVDPEGHRRRLAEEENRRFVSTHRRSNVAGLRTIVARSAAGDVARLEAMISHLAAQLEAAGDTNPLDFRRATALAMLANPAMTCLFLARDHSPSTTVGSDPHRGDAGACPQDGLFDDVAGLAAASAVEPNGAPSAPSAVELAIAFGQELRRLGSQALDRLRPQSVLYLHLAAEAVQGVEGCGVARVDDPLAGGPISTEQLRSWLRNHRVVVKPVIDPTGVESVDGYEVPMRQRQAVRLISPFETFPYGTQRTAEADLDHCVAYVPPDEGGPPKQTGIHNLGPLGRRHHLAKTFDGFTVHQLATNLYFWRTPTGHWYRVDHQGTTYLGKTRPPALDAVERLDPGTTTGAADKQAISPLERRLREAILRHLAA